MIATKGRARELQVGQVVEITQGHYKGREGWIGFLGGQFGGCPPIGKVVPQHSTCWVKIGDKRDKKEYVEINSDILIPLITAQDLQKEFNKKVVALQKQCLHTTVKESSRTVTSYGFYEPSVNYHTYRSYQCQVCWAFLKPNKKKQNKTKKWLPGKGEGYLQ